MDLAVIQDLIQRFPHSPRPPFHYAYVHTYSTYYPCLEWICNNAVEHANVSGDPDTHVYRFGFVSIKDYTNFLLLYSNKIIHAHSTEYPAVAEHPNTPL